MRSQLQALRRSASARLLLGDERVQDNNDSVTDQTPLDATISKIGFGLYQKKLLVLCGCGWLADNMWLQSVAVVLPRVQAEFGISDRWIGSLSSSIFLGMMLGAWSWGSYSDSYGRTVPFTGTLLISSIFGILAGFANSFLLLCFSFFGLGLGVGGSMPTDGTLFLENLPEDHHFLLTALSVFFSIGSIVTSSLALYIIPAYSCDDLNHAAVCDPDVSNQGWRVLLRSLAGITLLFCLCRVLLFKLYESPKYLVTAGQPQEAMVVLQNIAEINGSEFHVRMDDVSDSIDGHDSKSAANGYNSLRQEDTESPRSIKSTSASRISHLQRTIQDYVDRFSILLQPDLRRVTVIIWTMWFCVSAAYTIFNVFLPKFLEEKIGSDATAGTIVETLQEYCIYTLAGLPGSLVGAYLEKSVGKRQSLVFSTAATSLGVFSFVWVSSKTAVMLVSVWISFMGTLMYAVIYGYTPRLFPVGCRGSATGVASALSRLAGMTAPIPAGALLSVSTALPLYISASLFGLSAVFMLLLP